MDQATNASNGVIRSRDEGFTLVEVIMALVLLGMIAMASLGVFLKGMSTITHVQRQQAAVAVANSAMDVARSVSPGAVNAAGTIGVVKGRSASAVNTVWTDATTKNASDTVDMTAASDPTTGLTAADQWVPVRTTQRVDNVTYTVDTLVGTCYRLRAASSVSQDCVRFDTPPSGTTYAQMYRIRVVVRWDESSNGSKPQTYRMSTLIDPTADATWNTVLLPYAYDDEFTVAARSGTTYHAVVANDAVDYDESGTTSAIRNLSGVSPSSGGFTVAASSASGQVGGVLFTAPTSGTVSGTVTFTYKVEGTSGERSADPATVTVHVVPQPVVDNLTVAAGSTTNINSLLTANDIGVTNITPATRKTQVVVANSTSVDLFTTEDVTDAMKDARTADTAALAAKGITTDGSGNISFAAPTTAGNSTTFYYYLVDDPIGTGIRYPNTTPVAVTLTTETTPSAKDLEYSYQVTSASTANPIPWATDNVSPAGTKIKVISFAGPGTSPLNLAVGATGSTLTFTTTSTTAIGHYTIQYQTVSASGLTSATKTITVHVLPTGIKDPQTTSKTRSGNAVTYVVNPNPSGTANDFLPATGVRLGTVSVTSGPCTITTQPTTTDPFKFVANFGSGSSSSTACTLNYTVVSTGTGTYLTPAVESGVFTWAVTRGS
ncbi:MAG: type II secretion system GspH family protein [Demequina sp.]|nr:type II secretion system GspH family protein [Demequina sp.]